MSVVGFDIGNQTCYIAVARSGGIEVIDNEYSLRATPSYVSFSERSRDVGISAKTKAIPNIKNTVFGFKTLLGKMYNDAIKDLTYLPFDVCELPASTLGIKVNYLNEEKVFSVQQIMAMLFTKLKCLAEVKLGISVRECVISVPVFYTDAQRRAMLDAAEIAGLKPLKLMNEPTAVALYYGFYRQDLFDEPKTIIFIDLGESALTITACQFSKDHLRVIGSVWNSCVGGRDFDCVLVKHFVEEFRTRYNLDVMSNRKALMHLILECEVLKKQMSMNSRDLDLCIECFMNDIDVQGRMNRALFENLSSSLLLKIEEAMVDLLNQTGLESHNIYQVQMVGGSCRLPALKNIIHKIFGKEPVATLNLDEAVARGCALQCAFLSPTLKTKDFSIEDIQLFGIKVRSNPDDEIEVFPPFHKVPASKLVTFAFKPEFSLEAFYCDPFIYSSEILQAEFSDIPSELRESSNVRIKMKICLNNHGILNISSATIFSKRKDVSDEDASKQELEVASESSDALVAHDKILPEEQKCSKTREIIKSFDLTVKVHAPCLSRSDLFLLCEKEHDMINVDLQEKKIADLRNVVEEYVYSARGKLSNELKDFIVDDTRSQIYSILNQVEEWLYECENATETDYHHKLDKLKQLMHPYQSKCFEFQSVTNVLQEFQKILHESSLSISSLSQEERYAHIENHEIEHLENLWKEKKEYFNRCLSHLNRFNKCEDFPIKACIIREIMDAFQQEMQNIINKPCPKSMEQDEASAYGDTSDEQKQNDEVSSNDDGKTSNLSESEKVSHH